MPMTEDDIVAARIRASEGDVPWNRGQVIRQCLAVAKEKARIRRRNRIAMGACAAVALVLVVLWMLWSRR